MDYEQAKDDPRGALRFLSMILAAHCDKTPMTDARVEKAFHLLGALALASGIDADTIRAEMSAGFADVADEWYLDHIIKEMATSR